MLEKTFECLHCGECCVSPQINLTVGDIVRITDYGKKNFFKLEPFFNPSSPMIFDVELGLKMPCKFRKKGRCSIYNERPLNCRLFPFWVIAGVKKEEIPEYIGPEHRCVKKRHEHLKKEDIERFKEYRNKLAEILKIEDIETSSILKKFDFMKQISVLDYKKLNKLKELEEKYEKKLKPAKFLQEKKKIDRMKLKICKKIIKKNIDRKLVGKVLKQIYENDYILEILRNNKDDLNKLDKWFYGEKD